MCSAQSPEGLAESLHAVCMENALNKMRVLQYMDVCIAFEYNVCIQRRRKRKGNFGDPPGGLAE